MMIKPPHCIDCGAELKMRSSTRCQPCASHYNHRNHWVKKDLMILKVFYSHMSWRELHTLIPKHSIWSIQNKVRQLKLQRQPLTANHSADQLEKEFMRLRVELAKVMARHL